MGAWQAAPGRLSAHLQEIRRRSGSSAIDIRTGAIAWELPQPGPAHSWGGTRPPRPDWSFSC